MTSDGTNSYDWDAENRLIKITYPGASNNSQFSYDGLGRCVEIVETVSGTPSTLEFVWQGNKRRETRNGTNFGTVVNQFFPMGEVISGTSYYYTQDHLDSTRELVDGSGNVKTRYSYDPYGQATQTFVSGSIASDFQYAGFYDHSASGLCLARMRAYNASLGRFINRDPIEEDGGINLYGYVENNPSCYLDTLGIDRIYFGKASTYSLPGNKTAYGGKMTTQTMTAAMTGDKVSNGTKVKVRYYNPTKKTCSQVDVTINDTGPFQFDPKTGKRKVWTENGVSYVKPNADRVIDLSPAAFKKLTGQSSGVVYVEVVIPDKDQTVIRTNWPTPLQRM